MVRLLVMILSVQALRSRNQRQIWVAYSVATLSSSCQRILVVLVRVWLMRAIWLIRSSCIVFLYSYSYFQITRSRSQKLLMDCLTSYLQLTGSISMCVFSAPAKCSISLFCIQLPRVSSSTIAIGRYFISLSLHSFSIVGADNFPQMSLSPSSPSDIMIPTQIQMNSFPLPNDLPVPQDDGAANHLTGLNVPDLSFVATDGSSVNLKKVQGTVVLYVYPRTGQPGKALPEGWDQIPGARGCSPQSCAFSNLHSQFTKRGVSVFGLSSQDTEYQQQAWKRLELPFVLLSDEAMHLNKTLNLPTFQASGMQLYKRITLIIKDGLITKTFYPVFPPDKNAEEVLAWLSNQ